MLLAELIRFITRTHSPGSAELRATGSSASEPRRCALDTKNQDLTRGHDGSLTLTVGGDAPTEPSLLACRLPAPAEEFSLVLRGYWPDPTILDGAWRPPAVRRG